MPVDLRPGRLPRVVLRLEVPVALGPAEAEDLRAPLKAFRKISKLSKLDKISICSKICKFSTGSFSAVPKRNFARKYAFDSIFQALQDLHTFAPLQSKKNSKKSV